MTGTKHMIIPLTIMCGLTPLSVQDNSPTGENKMHRSTPNRKDSRRQFKSRVGRTERLNLAQPRRGGIRL